MQRIEAVKPEVATGRTKELFEAIRSKLGMVPNMMRTMGNSPAVLEGYLSFNESLGKSSIGAELGELLAVSVANANLCEYCNSAHSFIGEQLMGMDRESIEAARVGKSEDLKTQAALTFAKNLLEKKGKVNAEDISNLKDAGYTDAGVAEIIAHTALNIFTNYFNNAAMVVVDFPKVGLALAS